MGWRRGARCGPRAPRPDDPLAEPRLPSACQSATDYGPYLANEAGPLTPATLVARCTAKLVDDWAAMRAAASAPLARFMDLCAVGHMIDNVVLVVAGTLRERDVQELLDR